MINKELEDFLNEIPKETKIFIDLYADIVERINDLMHMRGYSQKDFAEKLDKRPSEINRWLKGEHNITLKSIAKMQAVLDEDIINIPAKRTFLAENTEEFNSKTSFTVYKNKTSHPVEMEEEKVFVSRTKISA